MLHWKFALAVGLPAAAVVIVLLVAIYNLFCCYNITKRRGLGDRGCVWHSHVNPYSSYGRHNSQGNLFINSHKIRKDPLDAALRHSSKVASVWRTTYPIKPFDWSEHPALVAEAVEHGWSAFAFTYTCSSCPAPVNFWDMCTSCSHKHDYEPDITWEVGSGSEYMQKLWLNPGLVPRKESYVVLVQALQAALPLPGPPLGSLSFPQEGYYEITVLAEGSAEAPRSSFAENEHVKLMSKHLLSGKHLGSEVPTNETLDGSGKQQLTKEMSKSFKLAETFQNLSSHIEFSKFSSKENHLVESLQSIAIGLAAGGAPPFRLPGFDCGSVGFHSNGHIYLNGALHVEQEPRVPAMSRSWGAVKTTVGCGFDPLAKKVYFTADGAHVYDLLASSIEFGYPLFPIVAANYDVKLLINFGQSPFEYAPANSHRVSDPCFRRPNSRSAKNGFVNEDSGDLFSMGRIDSQWFTGVQSPTSEDLQHRHVFSEADSDLFEIVLDPRVN
ncbi:hypothetical protein GOP47_0011023 [Adiantum capillus-veneris]|uniref:B30.2/SPRY domain-containing protein n=1 Tax=Adiantum capillus-veneris TaxID=13818 RepID=A0A9D4UWH9_ADICA|nr:hypothetical protein GOP47_0011023 [Adiantum capillus-veneris]